MAFNPLQNFLSGQQAGQAQQSNRLAGSVANEMQNPNFNSRTSADFQQLQTIDPERANKSLETFKSLSDDRKKAYFDDMVIGRSLLQANDMAGFGNFINDRLTNLNRLGSEDASGTEMIRDKFNEGDIQGIMQGYNTGIQAGQQLGFLGESQAGSQAKAFQDAGDGIVFNPNTGNFDRSENSKTLFDELAEKQNSIGLDVKDRQSINKDITGLLKDTTLINKTAKDLSALQKTSGGPASIAIVFKFMKALDPTSVVREGEFSTAENSAGTPDKIRNYYNKVVNGERLGPSQIADFIKTAQQLSNSAVESSGAEINKYLSTYEGTLGKEFSSRVLKRIPARFEMKDEATPPLLSNDFTILSVD
jgi:hypothetical protein